jgi:hypothetical protein
MEIEFPCGSKGRKEFCPDLCQFGEFCKVKDKKEEQPRGVAGLEAAQEQEEENDEPQEDEKVEIYY